jgi:acetyltransferase-like isoleucine patch superfamily enzyme
MKQDFSVTEEYTVTNPLKVWWRRVKRRLQFHEPLPKFGNTPRDLSVVEPFDFKNPERITFGDDVHIGAGSIIKANTETSRVMRLDDNSHVEQQFDARISFGHRVSATSGLHIIAYKSITIEDDVMIASNVYISDGTHGSTRIDLPYKYQGIIDIKPITLKRGCWIGRNVVIMPGVTVGEMAIVGANSVVTKSIPARSIAVGLPAKVVKVWSDEADDWVTL